MRSPRRALSLLLSAISLPPSLVVACAGTPPAAPVRIAASVSASTADAAPLPDAAASVSADPAPPLPIVAPGRRLAKASLFGTDVLGLPTGATITPDAAPGSRLFDLNPHARAAPGFLAMGAIATALSPDKKTLLVLTSGYNRLYDRDGKKIPSVSDEYVFVYDVAGAAPRETDVVRVPNAFVGLAFHPAGDRFYVSGGPDDCVHEVERHGAKWEKRAAPLTLGHRDKHGYGGLGMKMSPYAAGIALSTSGARLVVANHDNDSVTIFDTATRAKLDELKLPPGGAAAGGEYPLGVVVVGEDRAYVTCQRSREVVEIDLDRRSVLRRIKVGGQPARLTANRAGTRIYVANANSDTVSIIDRDAGSVAEIPTTAPDDMPAALRALRGSNPNGVALSPDEKTLYVTNGGTSTVAILSLVDTPRVVGLVPTGFYPHDVTVSADGASLFVAFGKSPTTANPHGPWSDVLRSREKPYAIAPGNEFSLQLQHGGLHAFPIPAPDARAKLTMQALINNRFHDDAVRVPPIFQALRGKVKHVVFVVGENRTYDQVLGDLAGADGDPKLLHWGDAITPNHHALARTFVTLDRFFDSGGVSGDGWQWTMGGRSTDFAEKEVPLQYADRGHHAYDWEGTNRAVNVGLATVAERIAYNPHTPKSPELLPGTADVAAIDGPNEGGRGFLWDVAIASGVSVRNYGAFVDDYRYHLPKKDGYFVEPLRAPQQTKTRVAFPTRASLAPITDPYFRGFDMKLADYWRFKEWEREFDEYVKKGELPALEIVRLPHDHFGSFGRADDAVDTPDTQMADHDYAFGLIVEKLSKSPFWAETVIIKIEDDAQNGADHVDSHRSFAIFAGGHVRRGAVVSTPYTTTSILRTIELLLGLPALGQQDAVARPMEDVFVEAVDATPFTAIVPAVLRSTRLPVPRPPGAQVAFPRGDAAWWAMETSDYDFSRVDAVPTTRFNRLLFCTLVTPAGCSTPAPLVASGGDDDD